MNKKYNYLIKNMGLLTLSNFSSKILVFLLVPLYTSILSTEEYGTYDLAVSTAALCFPIFTLNIVDAVTRFLLEKDSNKKDIAVIGIKYVLLSCVLFFTLVTCIGKISIFNPLKGLEMYLYLYYCSYIANQFFIQFSKGIEKVADMAIAGVLSTVTMIVTNVLFLIIFKCGLKGFFIANILSQFVAVVYFFIRLQFWTYLVQWKTNKNLAKEMLIYCIPLMATTIGWWINSTLDKYVVSFIMGVAANGVLSVSYKIPSIINTLQGIFTQAWQISAVKEYGEENTAVFYGNTFNVINMLMSVSCSVLIMFTKPLASILFAKDFYLAWNYVPLLLVSSVLNCASGLLGPILSAKKNSKAMMWSAIIGSGVNAILNIILVIIWGIQGATIATAVCSYVIYWVRKRAVGADICIVNYRNIIITWGVLIVQSYIEINSLYFLGEIFCFLIIVILNKESIIKIMDIIKNFSRQFLKKV